MRLKASSVFTKKDDILSSRCNWRRRQQQQRWYNSWARMDPANKASSLPQSDHSMSFCSNLCSLFLLRFALHITLPTVALAADTVDGVRFLFLCKNHHQPLYPTLPLSACWQNWVLTFKYSFVASCHSLVIVLGGGLAKEWMIMKRTTETAQPIPV
jgi:hypothetical protein